MFAPLERPRATIRAGSRSYRRGRVGDERRRARRCAPAGRECPGGRPPAAEEARHPGLADLAARREQRGAGQRAGGPARPGRARHRRCRAAAAASTAWRPARRRGRSPARLDVGWPDHHSAPRPDCGRHWRMSGSGVSAGSIRARMGSKSGGSARSRPSSRRARRRRTRPRHSVASSYRMPPGSRK